MNEIKEGQKFKAALQGKIHCRIGRQTQNKP
jgi:hypothetical protein